MSSATRFAAVMSLVGLIVAARPAPHVRSGRTASLMFFTDRAAFQAQAPNLTQQDFSQTNVPAGGFMSCPGPIDATTNNACVSSGVIQPGVRFNSDPPHDACVTACELALLGQGALNAPAKVLTENFFGDAFVMDFPGGNVGAIGADVVAFTFSNSSNNTCSIQVYGTGGLLGSTTSPCSNLGVFWGVKADEPITRIRITVPGMYVAGVADLAFGAGAPSTINVVLDVKPGSNPSPVNPASQGVTPVAVLGSASFDASQLDESSLAFGPGGAPAVHDSYQDMNGDGWPDLVVHFSTAAAKIACGDTQVTMTGRTLSGRKVAGAGPIVTVGCTKS